MIATPFRLTNLRVLVTRPMPEGEELCKAIEQLGGKAFHLPTIAIVPLMDDTFTRGLAALAEQDWLIFISPQAVYTSVSKIKAAYPILPQNLQIAAIGKSTAVALKKAGFSTVLCPEKEWNSESLLELPVFQHVSGKKIAIIRGVGGLNVLASILTDKGAVITDMIAYQRALPTINMLSYQQLIKEHALDVIVCTSGEGVKNLKTLFGELEEDALLTIPLLVVSERIKMLARDLGFQTIWKADNASHQAVLTSLSKIKKD